MGTIVLYGDKSVSLSSDGTASRFSNTLNVQASSSPYKMGVIGFAFNSDLNGKKIEAIDLVVTANENYSRVRSTDVSALSAAFDEATVLWSTIGSLHTLNNAYFSYGPTTATNEYAIPISSGELYSEANMRRIIENGVAVQVYYSNSAIYSTRYETRKPYLSITTTDGKLNIAADSLAPSGGFAGKHVENTFSWTIGQESGVYGTVERGVVKFRWREYGSETVNETTLSAGAEGYAVPAETFSSDVIEWQVVPYDASGNAGIASDWIALSTVDSLPTAVPVSPVNVVLDASVDNTFAWDHSIDTGTTPTRADLQYRSGSGVWLDLITVTGSATSVVVPADSLTAGSSVQWRVRTYNSDSALGEWSTPAGIAVRGAPAAPSITSVSNRARPVIQWQSTGQVAYEIVITQDDESVYATGEIAGSDKTHSVTEYLDDGSCIVSVRIKNEYGLFSDWTPYALTLSTTKPTQPVLTTQIIENGAQISVEADETAETIYLLRDGVPIAKITDVYSDYAALGQSVYIARAVSSDDCFSDSLPVVADVSVTGAVLAAVDALDNMVVMNKKRSGASAISSNKTFIGGPQHYAGREFPVYEFSEYTDETYAPAYYYTTLEEWRRLDGLLSQRKTLLYRDVLGNKYYGVVPTLSHTQENFMISFSFDMPRVDYVERLEYDPPEVV